MKVESCLKKFDLTEVEMYLILSLTKGHISIHLKKLIDFLSGFYRFVFNYFKCIRDCNGSPRWPRCSWSLTLRCGCPHLASVVLNGHLPWQGPKWDVAGGGRCRSLAGPSRRSVQQPIIRSRPRCPQHPLTVSRSLANTLNPKCFRHLTWAGFSFVFFPPSSAFQ